VFVVYPAHLPDAENDKYPAQKLLHHRLFLIKEKSYQDSHNCLQVKKVVSQNQGKASGTVKVQKPISAEIGVNCVLGNEREPGRIRLVDLTINEKANFLGRAALAAVNIKGRAQDKLRDPNSALASALSAQLEPLGVHLTGTELHFTNDALSVSLRGEPIARR